jgi:hypothetical protein
MTSSQLTRATRRTAAAAVLVLAGGLLLAGCSGAATTTAPVATTAPDATTAPAASDAATDAPASDANAGGCGAGAVTAITNGLPTDNPFTVKIIGGCHEADIETQLTKADAIIALHLCDKAAEVGYEDGVSSITVTGADGHELAAGVLGTDCIGEP